MEIDLICSRKSYICAKTVLCIPIFDLESRLLLLLLPPPPLLLRHGFTGPQLGCFCGRCQHGHLHPTSSPLAVASSSSSFSFDKLPEFCLLGLSALLIDILLNEFNPFHYAWRLPHPGSSVIRPVLLLKIYCFPHVLDITLESAHLCCDGRRGAHVEVELADSGSVK